MKKIIVADLHFDAKSDQNANEKDYYNKIKVFKEQIFPYMKKYNIKNIIQLGDATERRTQISTWVQHHLKKDIFDYLESNDIVMEYIIGNHDIFYKNTRNIFTLEIFEKAYTNNFKVYKNPTLVDNILYVPWLLDEDIKEVHSLLDKAKLCIGHFDIKDFNMSNSFKSINGLEKNYFKSVDVISGHYHSKQQQDNILYAGVPYQQSFSDFGDVNGFYVLDTNNPSINSLEYIETTVCTKHIKVFISSEDKKIKVFGFKEEIELDIDSKTDYSIFNNHKLKIFIDKNNAFNKKIIASVIENCVSYKIDILDEVKIEIKEESTEDSFNIVSTIKDNLETDYQKKIYHSILEKSMMEIEN